MSRPLAGTFVHLLLQLQLDFQLAAHAATAYAVAPGLAAAAWREVGTARSAPPLLMFMRVQKERQRGRVQRQRSEQLLIPQSEQEDSPDSSQRLPIAQGSQDR
eukprot:551788-Pelagomonas_calceolata.AAC.1